MKRLLTSIAAIALLSTSAWSAGPQNGTFAGQQPRGQSVSSAADKYRDAGSNYGQSWAEPRTQQAHGQPGPGSEVANDIQGHLAQDGGTNGPDIVGYGRNK